MFIKARIVKPYPFPHPPLIPVVLTFTAIVIIHHYHSKTANLINHVASGNVFTRQQSFRHKCLPHILYDKPVKTGSTAVTYAIREYLESRGARDRKCKTVDCIRRAEEMCNSTTPAKGMHSIIGHFKATDGNIIQCLRKKGFYSVTSIREPASRWASAWKFNRVRQGSHYGIPWNLTFVEFKKRLPPCILYHYYDGLGGECDAPSSVQARLENIVARHDEVVDLYDEPIGVLHKKIAKFVNRENESGSPDERYSETRDKEMKEEYMLYDRLRKLRLKLPDPRRFPC